jgi:intracellular sulfur oxidation DsrE/DsrF family protein
MLRRSFLARLQGLTSTAALFGAAAPSSSIGQSAASSSPFVPARHEQDNWFDELPGKHRVVFDTFMSEMFGEAVGFVGNYVSASKSAYELTDKDIAVVLTVRHQTAPFSFNDAMWAKYGKQFSDRMKFVDPKTKQPPTVNLYGAQLDRLSKSGMHLAICRLTTRAYTQIIANAFGTKADDVFNELAANTVAPGHFVPAGIVAVTRAQERGYALASIG